MSCEKRDTLEVLKAELAFLESGGYERWAHTPWKPTSIFQDSPTCLGRKSPSEEKGCEQCSLSQFVPDIFHTEDVPCHFIPLNTHGETVYSMERQHDHGEMQEAVKIWLRATIEKLEHERAKKT